MIEKCRLCSSSTALVTLTSGKCRQIRDYIRKLISITTSIQFKKNDALGLVCVTCMVQIYNFYLFRMRSLQNEKKLEELTRENKMTPRRNKIPIPDLCDITIPDVEDLKNILIPWIQSKLNLMECSEYENSFLSETDDTESSKKTELDLRSEISTQTTASTVVMIDEQVQAGPTATWNVSVQTFIKTADQKIQCSLGTSTADVFSQTYSNYEDQMTQSFNIFETLDEDIQCKILESHKPTMKIETCRDSCSNKEIPVITGFEKKTVDDSSCHNDGKLSEISDSDKDITILTAVCLVSKESIDQEKVVISSPQRDTRQTRLKQASVSPQCRRVNANTEGVTVQNNINESEESPVKITDENDKREEETVLLVLEKEACSEKTDCCESIKQSEDISKLFESITNQSNSEKLCSEKFLPRKSRKFSSEKFSPRKSGKFSSEKFSPRKSGKFSSEKFSPRKSGMKKVNMELVKSETNSPNTPPNRKKSGDSKADEHTQGCIQPHCLKFDSPRTSQLLTVKNKVQNVKICRQCDHTMYSKNEVIRHRRSHMRCPMCKKRFTSIVKTKMHISLECDQKISSMLPVVELNKMELPHDTVERIKNELIEMNSPNKRRKNHTLLSPGKKFKG